MHDHRQRPDREGRRQQPLDGPQDLPRLADRRGERAADRRARRVRRRGPADAEGDLHPRRQALPRHHPLVGGQAADGRAGLRQLDRRRGLRARHVRLHRDGARAGQGVPRRPAAGQDGDRRGVGRRVARRRRDARADVRAWPTTSPRTSTTPSGSGGGSWPGSTGARPECPGVSRLAPLATSTTDPWSGGEVATATSLDTRRLRRARGRPRGPARPHPHRPQGAVRPARGHRPDRRRPQRGQRRGLRRVQAALRRVAWSPAGRRSTATRSASWPTRRACCSPRRRRRRRSSSSSPTRSTRPCCSCTTPPATWSARSTSRAASSSTAP